MSEIQKPLLNEAPYPDKAVNIDGVDYRFRQVSTGRQVWDEASEQMTGEYYSLRTWFSHSSEGIGPGPGWDYRFGLSSLSPIEMSERYGHVFTADEIQSPATMPDDIPYYELVLHEKA